jgi:hypothetical protein
MEAKYYTMTEEDICIGLEFEVPHYNDGKEPEEYMKLIFNLNTIEYWFNKDSGAGYSIPENCRIKHLDRQDIEELGWKLYSQGNENYFTFRIHKNGDLQMGVSFGEPAKVNFSTRDGLETMKFILKNKSELQKLMKQLNIQTNKR